MVLPDIGSKIKLISTYTYAPSVLGKSATVRDISISENGHFWVHVDFDDPSGMIAPSMALSYFHSDRWEVLKTVQTQH